MDILQSIVEIVTYGDRHDPSIFEYVFVPFFSSIILVDMHCNTCFNNY